ncbi:nuclease A inhibitor family protein [Pontibacter ruber]|uniref:Nuclease A inhibitor family protein n=1 Tax=Pontibacter ruber TaxID=1343895 RepID=A0ABW5CSH6_9BACT|nr:nuclease A inhibitor family protein [Pontibacter ruber]
MDIKQIEAELKKASNGLLMMSETDEPFEFYYDEEHVANNLDTENVLKLAGMPAEYPAEVVDLEYFFRNMTRPDVAGEQQAQGFQRLQATLHELLQDVKVYRIGENRITVFILGKTPDGKIAGLKTVVVET